MKHQNQNDYPSGISAAKQAANRMCSRTLDEIKVWGEQDYKTMPQGARAVESGCNKLHIRSSNRVQYDYILLRDSHNVRYTSCEKLKYMASLCLITFMVAFPGGISSVGFSSCRR
jgi:hypothetical protein